MAEDKTPWTPEPWHCISQEKRDRVRDLYDGTEKVREGGTRYLPVAEVESQKRYKARLARATVFPAYQESIDSLVGRAFKRPPTIEGAEALDEAGYFENIDLGGTSFLGLLRNIFRTAYNEGIAFFHVDYTTPQREDGAPRTMADDDMDPARPYIRTVSQSNLIYLRTDQVGGKLVIAEARIREWVEEEDGEWGKKIVPQIRHLLRGEFQVLRPKNGQETDKEWIVYEEGQTLDARGNQVMDVPLIPAYTNRTGFCRGLPPLGDLVHLNIAHYQVASDLRTSIYYAANPLLYITGMDPTAMKNGVKLSPEGVFILSNPQSKLGWAELTGGSTKTAQEYLEQLEKQMDVLSVQPLVSTRSVQRTATEVASDQADEVSELEAVSREFERSAEAALGWMFRWMAVEVPGDLAVIMNGDFNLATDEVEKAGKVLEARKMGDLSLRGTLEELQALNILSEDRNLDDEIEAIQMEGAERMAAMAKAEADEAERRAAEQEPPDESGEGRTMIR